MGTTFTLRTAHIRHNPYQSYNKNAGIPKNSKDFALFIYK